MKFFTFYTKNTPYEQEANMTIEAFASFNLQCAAIAYENKRDWMTNAMARSAMILELAEQFPGEHLGVVDADNRPVRRPQKLIDFNADFGCEDRGEKKRTNMRYSAGIMAFGATELGRKVLKDWKINCEFDAAQRMQLREQYYLYQAVHPMRGNPDFRFENFGNEYNRKPEDVTPGDDTVFIHDVASRRFLRQIGGHR